MRIPNDAHEAHPWRIRGIVTDFTLEDVWALPVHGDAGDFATLLDVYSSLDFPRSAPLPVRVLWSARDRLGRWFGLGRISDARAGPAEENAERLPIPGTHETSLADRLPDDLRGTATEAEFGSTPFVPLYRTDVEYAAEVSNRTVHAVLHLAWAETGDGGYQGQMAVYVKPRGRFGEGYMAFIRPFRHLVVYPALMRHIERAWSRRVITATRGHASDAPTGEERMPDHGRDVKFGYSLIPNAADPLLAKAQQVERLGLDYIGVQDHPYQRRYVDTFSLLAMIGAGTSRVGLFPDVANLPLRQPAVLAKTAATIDVLSGGRFELGLGAGGFWDAIQAYGGPRRGPGESLGALAEALEVIRKLWSGDRNLRFEGRYYRLAGAQSGPVPAHGIGIWLGVYGPRALRLVGRSADGWVPSFRGELAPIAAMAALVDEAAHDAGREPGAIRRVLNVAGSVTDGVTEGPFRGPVEQWTDELTGLVIEQGSTRSWCGPRTTAI